MIMFPLVPQNERGPSQQQIVDDVRKSLSQVTAFRATPVQMPTVGRGFNQPVQLVLQNSDFDALAKELPDLPQAAREIPGLTAVNEDLKLDRPELRSRRSIERRRAALGVQVNDVARTLEVMTGGLEISQFKRGVREYKVHGGARAVAARRSPTTSTGIYVRAGDGRMVPLSTSCGREGTGPATRYHYDRSPSATISANLDGISMGEGIAADPEARGRHAACGFRTRWRAVEGLRGRHVRARPAVLPVAALRLPAARARSSIRSSRRSRSCSPSRSRSRAPSPRC
jgi:multidrug efflux pump